MEVSLDANLAFIIQNLKIVKTILQDVANIFFLKLPSFRCVMSYRNEKEEKKEMEKNGLKTIKTTPMIVEIITNALTAINNLIELWELKKKQNQI